MYQVGANPNLNAQQLGGALIAQQNSEHHETPADTSEGLRFPNLSRYGSDHPADVALGKYHIAKSVGASLSGTPSAGDLLQNTKGIMESAEPDNVAGVG